MPWFFVGSSAASATMASFLSVGGLPTLSQHPAAVGGGNVFGRNGMVQMIDDGYRLRSRPTDQVGLSQEGVIHGRSIAFLFSFPHEEEYVAAPLLLMKVALACR